MEIQNENVLWTDWTRKLQASGSYTIPLSNNLTLPMTMNLVKEYFLQKNQAMTRQNICKQEL